MAAREGIFRVKATKLVTHITHLKTTQRCAASVKVSNTCFLASRRACVACEGPEKEAVCCFLMWLNSRKNRIPTVRGIGLCKDELKERRPCRLVFPLDPWVSAVEEETWNLCIHAYGDGVHSLMQVWVRKNGVGKEWRGKEGRYGDVIMGVEKRERKCGE